MVVLPEESCQHPAWLVGDATRGVWAASMPYSSAATQKTQDWGSARDWGDPPGAGGALLHRGYADGGQHGQGEEKEGVCSQWDAGSGMQVCPHGSAELQAAAVRGVT